MDPFASIPRARGKWSKRMRLLFQHQGKRWDDAVEAAVKKRVAQAVAANASEALEHGCEDVIETLAVALTKRLRPA